MLQSVPMNAQTKVCVTAIRQSLCSTANFSLRTTDIQPNRLYYKREKGHNLKFDAQKSFLLLDAIYVVWQLAESNLHVS